MQNRLLAEFGPCLRQLVSAESRNKVTQALFAPNHNDARTPKNLAFFAPASPRNFGVQQKPDLFFAPAPESDSACAGRYLAKKAEAATTWRRQVTPRRER